MYQAARAAETKSITDLARQQQRPTRCKSKEEALPAKTAAVLDEL